MPIFSPGFGKVDVNAVVKKKSVTDLRLHLNDKLWIGVGKALELVLVQVHDEEFIGWSQLDGHLGKLLVEVCGVAPIFLEIVKDTLRGNKVLSAKVPELMR